MRSLIAALGLLCCFKTCIAKPPLPPPDPDKTGSFDLIIQANLELKPNVKYSSPPLPDHVFEADIALTSDQKRNIDLFGNVGRGASKDTNLRWPDGIIPYEIDCSLQRMPNAIKAIKDAITEWESKTCIRFVQRTGQKDHVWFFRQKGCWSNLGRIGKKNMLSVGDGCEYKHVMVHEIGHAIGFWHEQSRPDRDSYVRVNTENILPGLESAFEKYGRGKIDSMNIPYDYESIMHYPFTAFSKNGKPTLTALRPLNGKTPYRKLSSLDAQQANLMYNNCGRSPLPKGPKRQGLNPAGKTRQKRAVCADYNRYCSSWASRGQCRYNPNYMRRMCRKSCRLCSTTTTSSCRDLNRYCNSWRRLGQCRRNPRYMNIYCKRSCGKCPRPPRPRPPTERPRPPTQRPRPPTQRPRPPTQRPRPPTQRPQPPTVPPKPPTQPPSRNCGIRYYGRNPGRIVDGQTAAKNSWPWQVEILTPYGNHHCGGSLLTDEWLLTAAHCIASTTKGYTVKLGEHHLQRNDGTEQTFSIRQAIKHPNYDRSTLENDIALIRLDRPAKLSKAVNTVCLPKQDVNVRPGTNCYVTGWGRTKYNKPGSVVLQEAMMPIVSQQTCAKAMLRYGLISKAMVCGGYGGSSTISGCNGDSGGPFVCRQSNSRWVVQGVVSWGTRTCSAGANQYTVFARVSEFADWIRRYTGSTVPATPPRPQTPPIGTLPPTPPPPVTPPQPGTPPRPQTPPTGTLPPTPPRPNTPPQPGTLPPTPPEPQTPPIKTSPPVKKCNVPEALGMENRQIPDSAISASSQVNGYHSASEGRLHQRSGVTGVGAWCALTQTKNEYLEIDLGQPTQIDRIATQGRKSKYPKYVKLYQLQYSDDGLTWTTYPRLFPGNVDMSTVSTNTVNPPIVARYLRIVPKDWKLSICLRAELYGCPDKKPTTIPTTTEKPSTSQRATTTTSPPSTTVVTTTTGLPATTTGLPDTTTQPPLPPTPPRPPTTSPGIKTIPPNPIGIKCKDNHPSCPSWAKAGRCNEPYMKRNCLKSCTTTNQCDREPVRPFAPCSNRLGLGWDFTLPDSAFTASSELNLGSWDAGARNARLYIRDDHTNKRVGAWCAASNKDQWLQVDLGAKTYITAIATQGRDKYFEHVKTYKLSHSIDGTKWDFVKDDSGAVKVFDGNCDHFTPVVNALPRAVSARYVKIHLLTASFVCMRVELYGCT